MTRKQRREAAVIVLIFAGLIAMAPKFWAVLALLGAIAVWQVFDN